jgi:hypothetical protein
MQLPRYVHHMQGLEHFLPQCACTLPQRLSLLLMLVVLLLMLICCAADAGLDAGYASP